MLRLYSVLFVLLFAISSKAQEVTFSHSVYNSFIENKGQWNDNVFFKNKFDGGNMWVEQGRVLFQIQDYSSLQEAHYSKNTNEDATTYKEKLVQLEFVDALEIKEIEKKGRSKHYYNYFIGNDKSKWASDVHGFEEFTLKEIYEGVNVRFIEQGAVIKYEFQVAPMADPDQIKLKYFGQQKLKIDKKGNLLIQTELGEILEEKPYVYQIINGKVIEISSAYKIEGEVVTFELGEYNNNAALIIDPTLVFATYNGAISDNFGMTATYGHDGSAYSAGTIYGNSHPIPDPDAFDVTSNMTVVNVNIVTTDAFITKYSADGTDMIWATFYGGGDNTQGTDVPHSLICDLDDNIYAFGTTSSLDFPVENAFQPVFGGGTPFSVTNNGINFGTAGTDMYVSKFSANGHDLLGSTYIGGDKNDGVNYIVSAGNYTNYQAYDSLTMNYGDQFRGEIMLDQNNNVIVGSCTRSDNFPTKNPFQPNRSGQQDGVILKLKHDFSDLIFSSFYGGVEADAIYSVKVDTDDNIIFGGGTISTDLPVTSGVYQNSYAGGKADGFIAKLSPDGTAMTHATYIGTDNYDQVFFVEVNDEDDIYVYGQSNGGNFPIVNAGYYNTNSSQFIARLDSDLTILKNATVFGSGSTSFDISPSAFMVDICGNIYISGWGGSVLAGGTPMSGMPISSGAFQTTTDGFDFYLMVLERDFSGIIYGTYIGGTQSPDHVDGGTSRFDKNGIIYQCVCGGCGGKSDFATTPGAWSSTNMANNCNALTFKFDFNLIPKSEFSIDVDSGCAPVEINFTNTSVGADSYVWDFGNGITDSTTFNPSITYTEPGSYEVTLIVTDSICLITDTMAFVIDVFPAIDLDVSADIDLCVPVPITLTANSNGTADEFIWSSNPNFTDMLNTSTADSTALIEVPEAGYYYVKAFNDECEAIDSVLIQLTSAELVLEGEVNLCYGDETTITATSTNPAIQFDNFTWSPSDIIVSGNGTSTVVVNPGESQYLYVTADADNGCEVTDSIQVFVSDIDITSVIATASDSVVPTGGEVILTANPSGYSYTWMPSDGVENPNSQETSATVNGTTTYTVLVSDGICTKSTSVTVKSFTYDCDEPYIYVPNAFSPNGDGNNDILYVRSQVLATVLFRVYDRWGEKVFETTNLHTGWDGTFRGKPLTPDVYDYYLEGKCIENQEYIIKGNITLIR